MSAPLSDDQLADALEGVCLTLYDSEEAEDDPIVCGEFRRAQNTVLEAAKRLRAARVSEPVMRPGDTILDPAIRLVEHADGSAESFGPIG